MALQQAQLGQLPYMNLARYIPDRVPLEPAWHKALTALLVQGAGTAGGEFAKNALARDFTPEAVKAGLAPEGSTAPSFGSQVLHGPDWDQKRLEEESRLGVERDRNTVTEKDAAARLGLTEQEMKSLNDYRQKELLQRQTEQGNRESERTATDKYNTSRLGEEHRHNLATEGLGATKADDPYVKAERDARTRLLQTQQLEADEKLQTAKEMHKQLKDLFPSAPGSTNSSTGQPPSSNNDNAADPHNSGPSTPNFGVPSLPPSTSTINSNSDMGLSSLLSPTQGTSMARTPSAVPSVSDVLGAREAANRATAAGTSSQMGQSAAMTPQGAPDNAPAPITQPQPTAQAVGTTGFPSDALALTRPPQTPNSPTAIPASSAPDMSLPPRFSPQLINQIALWAKMRQGMLPQSMGGAPGAGGIPLGFG